jgi:mono/diheme cytochrome c family protein
MPNQTTLKQTTNGAPTMPTQPGTLQSNVAPNATESRELADSRVARGLEISPVPLDRRGKNPVLLGLGSYLVNAAGGCNDCHTSPSYLPSGDPFKGETEIINTAQFLAGGRRFGPIVSANLTPDEFGRPAGLTFEQFATALRTGRDPDDASHILQVMPWPVYGNMTDLDLRALYEYLRAIPSLPDNVAQEVTPEVPPAPSGSQ